PEQSHGDQDEAGQQRRDHQSIDAVLQHDARHDDHERAGGPADLHAGAAEQRDEKARDDGGVEPALRAEPARDRERDGQRQRDDADDDAGNQVPGELLPVVVLEGGDQLGNEHGGGKILNSGMASRLAATPFEMKYARTASARALDRRMFASRFPTLSVCPSITTFTSGRCCIPWTARLSGPCEFNVSFALPDRKVTPSRTTTAAAAAGQPVASTAVPAGRSEEHTSEL